MKATPQEGEGNSKWKGEVGASRHKAVRQGRESQKRLVWSLVQKDECDREIGRDRSGLTRGIWGGGDWVQWGATAKFRSPQ